MPNFHRLDLIDGTFILVRVPLESEFDEVRAYHLELLNEVRQFEGYYLLEADPILFAEFEFYYQAIASRLHPVFGPNAIASESRHAFFIATAPVPHPEAEEQLVPGVSHLERMMGFGYGRAGERALITTGDAGLDLRASLALSFKELTPWLIENHSRDELALLLQQANDLMRPEALKEKQQARDRESFAKRSQAIAAQLDGMGIVLPEDFADN